MTSNDISIQAKTATLLYSDNGLSNLIDSVTKYNIPIYQRPYSWKEEQIRTFIQDIFNSYWGVDKSIVEEPMFIGTMLLSTRSLNNTKDIIDGQQRLTTFLILLKCLSVRFSDSFELSKFSFDWLSTAVDENVQQKYLEAFLKNNSYTENLLNPYTTNAHLINNLLDEFLKDDNGESVDINVDSFVKYLLGKIYFVVIETNTGLTKTLKIFDSINTTGMDLNLGDIFKLRLYEYLSHKKQVESNETFKKISEIYQLVEEYNNELEYKFTDINEILWMYQFLTISEYSLSYTLYSYGTETYYDELFAFLLQKKYTEHFNTAHNNIDVSVEKLIKIIEARKKWEENWWKTAEDMCCYEIVSNSRYSRYCDLLPTLLLYKLPNADIHLFVRLLARVYFIYSIRYDKSIYEIHSWTYSLIRHILSNSFESIIDEIKQKIGSVESQDIGYKPFSEQLTENLTENYRRKTLVCRLSAMIEEDLTTQDKKKCNEIRNKIFKSPIDIEHIQAYLDRDLDKRDKILMEWDDNINSLGNLVLLEEKINRSISNIQPFEKVLRYQESNFNIIQNFITNSDYNDWSLSKCQQRKNNELNKIRNYIFKI